MTDLLRQEITATADTIVVKVGTRVLTGPDGGLDESRIASLSEEIHKLRAGGRNVVLLAYSEFGRRVRANASQGTDHGTAGPVCVAGVPVNGGFYGDLVKLLLYCQRSLASLPNAFVAKKENRLCLKQSFLA